MAQIFISYRRDGGEALAYTLNKELRERGYSVFYDTESLTSEVFDERLLSEIEECDDFVLILPPKGLDRCLENNDDWVRREIRHAIAHSKHIVPVLMRGFKFPENLPSDIRNVKSYHGVDFESMEFMDARLEKLCDFLKSKPSVFRAGRPKRAKTVKKEAKDLKTKIKKIVIAIIVLFVCDILFFEGSLFGFIFDLFWYSDYYYYY